MDLEVALAALFGYRQVAHWLYNLRGPTEYSCKVGVYHLLTYLGFEVYMAPSTLRISLFRDFACFITPVAVVSLV